MIGRDVVAIAVLTTSMIGCGLVRPVALARTCAEWSLLDAGERLQTAEALVAPELMATVRERQHLPAETVDADVFAAVAGTFDKICEIERRPGLPLAEIVTSVYR